jgi:broad specificity phosphatase PhoE
MEHNVNAELIKQLREEAERLSARSLDRGIQEAGIAANLAERAADTIEEILKALKEAAEFIQPFNRAQELLGRVESAISKATA